MSVSKQRISSASFSAGDEDRGPILVVEDDPALRELIEMRLAANGHQTVGAPNGAAALEWLRQDSPSLILLDYGLPDMCGDELVEKIQAQGRRVPFVVATGNGNESVAVKMMKRGAYDYLVKGASFMKMLLPVVDRAIERDRQARRLIQSEMRLNEAHEELEQRIQQRTEELARANRQLRMEMEERRRAEERVQQHLNELAHVMRLNTVGEMVVELTHELNQPLSAVSSYAHACKRLLASDRAEDREDLLGSLQQISEQADRAADIIRRLRRFVMKAQPLQTLLDLNATIHDVAKLLSIPARLTGIEMRLDLAKSLPPVVGDRVQLEQVLVNLMRNAMDAMRDCEPEYRQLTIRTISDGQGSVAVEVHDLGTGVPPGVIEHVFERFFTTKTHGMGMGLPICQSIVEKHRGTIWVTPNADRGSTFHFTLPIDFGERNHGS